MTNENQNTDEGIANRRWYERPLWGLWLFLEIIFLQSAFASYQELEPRAAILFIGIFITLLLSAATLHIVRRNRLL